jgi:hypothetical protein
VVLLVLQDPPVLLDHQDHQDHLVLREHQADLIFYPL